jgi:hypothetical protein
MVGTNCGQNFFESSYGEKPAVSNGYRLCRWAIVIHCDDALGSVNNGFSHRRIVVGRTTSELMDGSGHLRFRSASSVLSCRICPTTPVGKKRRRVLVHSPKICYRHKMRPPVQKLKRAAGVIALVGLIALMPAAKSSSDAIGQVT